jgi:formiminoglutamase
MDLFNPKFIRRVDQNIYYSRGDANDPRLGECVARTTPGHYGEAQVVLIGCPQDEGVRRNFGRPGAAQGPQEIRRALYRLTVNGLENLRLLDLGDLVIQQRLEQTHALLQQWVQRLIEDGKRVIVLGGGNDISYASCSALSLATPSMLAFNVDAHYDVRENQPCNSGTPYRQLIEEGFLKPSMFYEIGFQPALNSAVYAEYLRAKGVNTCSLAGLREIGVAATFKRALKRKSNFEAVFWGFDLDVVCAADAPGVSAPSAIGLSGSELCEIAAIAGGDPRTRVVEFTEVCPAHDLDGRTSRLAALAIWHYLAALEPQL